MIYLFSISHSSHIYLTTRLLHGDYYYYDNHVFVVDKYNETFRYSDDYAYHNSYGIEMKYSKMNGRRHFIEYATNHPFDIKCFIEERISHTIFEKL